MNLKHTAVAAVIGGALALMPATPAAAFPVPARPFAPAVPVAADPPKKTPEERLDDIEKKLTDLIELVKGKKDSQGFAIQSDPGVVAEVKRLKDEVAALKTQLEAMKGSTSLRPPVPDPMAGKGIVRVVNDYAVEITIVVNNNSYRVPPSTKLDITVPMGEFTYQLLNAGANLAATRSPIKEKEVVTLRIK